MATNTNPGASVGRTADAEARRVGRMLAGTFLLMAAALVVAGYLYVSRQQAEARATAHRELSTIADLKLSQITNWREERLSDARFFSRARFVAQDVRRLVDEPDSEAARAAVLQWMDLLKGGARYAAVMVFDPRFERRLSLPASAAQPAASTRKLLAQAVQSRKVVFGDLHRDTTNGPVYLDMAFPVFEGADVKAGAPLAAVLLQLDARQFLFPLVQTWPEPSATAETLLVRREGDEVLFLNDLRHRPRTALTLRIPLSSSELPAAEVLRGDTSVLSGVDYRGVPVVAAGRPVPGTDWAMVAKIDREEVYAPLRKQTFAALAVLASLLVAAALLVALLWRQRTAQFLERELAERKAHEQEMERMNRLYAALSQVNQAVVRAGSRKELLQQICRALVDFGGFQMAWIGLVDPATKRVFPVAQCRDDGYLQRIEVYADDRPEGRGPVGTSIREGRRCVCNDLFGDPKMNPWRAAAKLSGWNSLAAFPIREQNSICGSLAVYSSQRDFFGPQEQGLLEEVAGDVSFGLDTLLSNERRKQAEEALRQARDELARANAALEQKVEQRTAQLAEVNSNLQNFAYAAAHDLRAPLRSITSFSSLVLEDCGAGMGAEERSMLERVVAAAKQMAGLLDDLLEYSRIGQADLKLEPVSLQKAVGEALKLLDGDIRAKKAVVTAAEPLPEVIGHSATVLLLINNLLSNALKFMPPGVQPQVRIWADRAMDRVRLWVQDNGIGIAPEHLEKIFAPFQRLHGKGAYAGTGLGLAIVSKGAERMGGHAGVESELGKGSRFWVEFKAA